jgi:hypothetical protein
VKRCSSCREQKPLAEFALKPVKNRGPQGLKRRDNYCIPCRREYQRQWYAKNRERHRKNVRKNMAASIARAREVVLGHLQQNPCADCGEADIVVLEFDHVRGEKVAAISQLVCAGHSAAKIRAEIDKCDVVCANCHRRRTSQRAGWWKQGLPAIPAEA